MKYLIANTCSARFTSNSVGFLRKLLRFCHHEFYVISKNYVNCYITYGKVLLIKSAHFYQVIFIE